MPASISATVFLAALFDLVLAFALPIGLALLLCRRHKGALRAVLMGAFCFIVGARVLEQLMHAVVFTLFPTLPQNIVLYVLYGALAAGVFEETARLIGLRYLCRKDAAPAIGFAYGIGHGGIEAILLLGLGMVNQLIVITTVNSGNAASLLVGLNDTQQATMTAQLNALAQTPATTVLAGGWERVTAVALHIALSVLVWMVVAKRIGMWGYPLAIGLHALVDIAPVLYQTGILRGIWLLELILTVFVAAIVALVVRIYRKNVPDKIWE